MRVAVRKTLAGTVGSLEKKPYLNLVDDSTEVEFIKSYFGDRPAVRDFGGFMVKIEDGEFTEVYGFEGNIGYTYKPVWKITRTFSESKSKNQTRRTVNPRARRERPSTSLGGVGR